MARIKGKKRIVVKVGTSTLTHQTGKTNIARLAKLASVLSDLKNEGHEIVLVSSGAIAVGWSKLSEKPKTVQGLQASAAVGQCELMFLYDKLFSEYTVTVSQLLFSADTLRNPEEKEHLVDTFNQLLDYGALPIINENDSVYIEELLNGDNDCLSAMVATLIDADLLIMLTDTYGLYDSNPSENDDAKLIGVVEEINDDAQGIIRITLKYDEKGARVIDGLKRISKPGLRVYASAEKLPKVLNGLGIALISTSKGIKTDKEARKENLGGEVLAYIW